MSDDTRILAHVPLIKQLIDDGAAVVLCSHFGRPKGQPVEKYSLKPVAQRLSEVIGKNVFFADDCVGPEAEQAKASLKSGEILVLENLRFHKEEEANGSDFARQLSAGCDVFIMDAFSASHRAHASTAAIVEHIKSFAGPLLIREIEMLSAVRDDPKKPFVLILGGAKVSDKIGVIDNMIDKVDSILIGGGMAFTFLKSRGREIGKSLCEADKLEFAAEMTKKAEARGVKLVLPVDVVVSSSIDDGDGAKSVSIDDIPADMMGLDIGPESEKLFCSVLDGAKTVLFNGPMGVFEKPAFSSGTKAVVDRLAAITSHGAMTVVGGGDSAAAVAANSHEHDVSHVSTGGGASLEFFEGKVLPGVKPYII